MAYDFQAFVEKASRLASEETQAKAAMNRNEDAIARTKERLALLESKGHKLKEALDGISYQQMALMGGKDAVTQAPGASFQASPTACDQGVSPSLKVDPEMMEIDKQQEDAARATPHRNECNTAPKAPYNLISTFKVVPKDLWYQCLRAKPIHPSFPSVIYLDKEWTEIACGFCGANASYRDNELKLYGAGFMGLYNHFRAAHKDIIEVSVGLMVKTCRRRMISDEDVALMKQGRAPTVKITPTAFSKKKAPIHAGWNLHQDDTEGPPVSLQQSSSTFQLYSTSNSPSFPATNSHQLPAKSVTTDEGWKGSQMEVTAGGTNGVKKHKTVDMIETTGKRACDCDEDDEEKFRPFKRFSH